MFGRETKVDVGMALVVYEKVVQYGSKVNGERFLDGIWVSADFDGYTIFLRDDLVKLTLFFHNKYHVDCLSRRGLMAFNEKIERIYNNQYS